MGGSSSSTSFLWRHFYTAHFYTANIITDKILTFFQYLWLSVNTFDFRSMLLQLFSAPTNIFWAVYKWRQYYVLGGAAKRLYIHHIVNLEKENVLVNPKLCYR